MVEELGEAISIIKKKEDSEIMKNAEIRRHYIEELSDILMYFNHMLLCYNISAKELSHIYVEKHKRNLGRNYIEEYDSVNK